LNTKISSDESHDCGEKMEREERKGEKEEIREERVSNADRNPIESVLIGSSSIRASARSVFFCGFNSVRFLYGNGT